MANLVGLLPRTQDMPGNVLTLSQIQHRGAVAISQRADWTAPAADKENKPESAGLLTQQACDWELRV